MPRQDIGMDDRTTASVSPQRVSEMEKVAANFVVSDDKEVSVDADLACITVNESNAHIHGVELTVVILAVYLAVFCVSLDNTIITTAVPTITNEFHSIQDIGWYGSVYLLCEAAFQLLFGKLYKLFNTKYIFLGAVVLFEVGSAVCASAPQSAVFIVGRGISGVGSAGIFCGAIVIIARSVRLSQRPMYISAFGALYGIAAVTGPVAGGALTSRVTWRWCFYINIPAGVVTAIFILLAYRSRDPSSAGGNAQGWKAKLAGLDFLGTAFFIPSVVCLLLALQWGGVRYDWNGWRIITTLVLFPCLALIFCMIQWQRQDTATLPPRVLKQRSILAAAWFGFCISGSFFSVVYFLPIWFQAIQGVDAIQSGIRTIPLIISLVTATMTSGIAISTVVGYYNPFMIASSALAAVGAGLFGLLTVDSRSAAWIGFQTLYGIGIGFGTQQTMVVVQRVLTDVDVPIGTAFINFAQTLGGTISISVASNIFDNSLVNELHRVVPEIDPSQFLLAGATGIRDLTPAEALPEVLRAYNIALVRVFLVPAILAALSMLGNLALEWRSVRQTSTRK